eukprot:1144068-Pelagomonas_calceolata.AAC.1
MHSSKGWGHTQCSTLYFGSQTGQIIAASHGATQYVFLCCGAEHPELGVHMRALLELYMRLSILWLLDILLHCYFPDKHGLLAVIVLTNDFYAKNFYVTHMLYADDLPLMANDPVALQTMLNCLHAHAQRKHLIINSAKSEVVHLSSSGTDLPCMTMAKSSEHAAGPFMASAFWVHQFVCENFLANRLYVSLWLGRTYVVPAGMYAGQVWGNEYIKAGKEFASELQVRHMSYFKGTLGVKRITTNWAVLRECGHEPLQFYWFRSAVKLYNSMLRSNSDTLRSVLKADLKFHSREPSCWTAQVLGAFQGLRRCDSFVQAVRQGTPIPI